MKALKSIALILLLAPAPFSAHAANSSDLADAIEAMAQNGLLINSIAADWSHGWHLSPEEWQATPFPKLAMLGSEMAKAAMDLSGHPPTPISASIPDETQERKELLFEAARLQLEADGIIIGMRPSKNTDGAKLEKALDLASRASEILEKMAAP